MVPYDIEMLRSIFYIVRFLWFPDHQRKLLEERDALKKKVRVLVDRLEWGHESPALVTEKEWLRRRPSLPSVKMSSGGGRGGVGGEGWGGRASCGGAVRWIWP